MNTEIVFIWANANVRSSAVIKNCLKKHLHRFLRRNSVEAMGAVAVNACKEIGYSSAGTFEFLLDEDGSFILWK